MERCQSGRLSTLGNCSDGLRWRAADFDYRCEGKHLTAFASTPSITVNLGRSRRIDRVTSQLRHIGLKRKMGNMPRHARVVTWNGKDVPPELRELPAGRYVVEAVDEEAPGLSPEEEAGIEVALDSYRQGRVVDAKRAREIIDAALGR